MTTSNALLVTAVLTAALAIPGCNQSHSPAAPPPAPPAKAEVNPPSLPEAQSGIAIPAGHAPFLKLQGDGTQIYSCQERGPKEFAWKLGMPDAVLIGRDHQRAGKHYKGPTWEANDGSKVVAAPELAVDAPDPKSAIKWVRLKATSHEKDGTFAKVSYIQRVDTAGGLMPTEPCNAKRAGGEPVAVHYTANYYFFAPVP